LTFLDTLVILSCVMVIPAPESSGGGPKLPPFVQSASKSNSQNSSDAARQRREFFLIDQLDNYIGRHVLSIMESNASEKVKKQKLTRIVGQNSNLFLTKNLSAGYTPEEIKSALTKKLAQLEDDQTHTDLSKQLYTEILYQVLDNLKDGFGSQSRETAELLSLPPALNTSTEQKKSEPLRTPSQELASIAEKIIKADEQRFLLNAIESIYDIASGTEIYAYANNGGVVKCNLLEALLQEPPTDYQKRHSAWHDFKNSNPNNQEIETHYKDLMESIGKWFATDLNIRHPMTREIDENENRSVQSFLNKVDEVASLARYASQKVTGKLNREEWKYTPFSELPAMKRLGLENPESLFLRRDFLNEFRQSRVKLLTDPKVVAEVDIHNILRKMYGL
jgi:hypothetical protein